MEHQPPDDRSPLSVPGRPPSLVVDRFGDLVGEDELLLAASAHHTDRDKGCALADRWVAAARRDLLEVAVSEPVTVGAEVSDEL